MNGCHKSRPDDDEWLSVLIRRGRPYVMSEGGYGRKLCSTDIDTSGDMISDTGHKNSKKMERLARMILQEMYLPAFVGLAVSGASDWLDGYVARRMGINSVVGSYVDPLADKILIGCVALTMVDKGLLHLGLVVLRDVALIGGALYRRTSSLAWEWKSWSDFFNIDRTRPEKVEPLFLSKVNTFFQLALVAAALLRPEFGTPETEAYITYLSWLVASTTVASTAAYEAQHLRGRYVTSIWNQ